MYQIARYRVQISTFRFLDVFLIKVGKYGDLWGKLTHKVGNYVYMGRKDVFYIWKRPENV